MIPPHVTPVRSNLKPKTPENRFDRPKSWTRASFPYDDYLALALINSSLRAYSLDG